MMHHGNLHTFLGSIIFFPPHHPAHREARVLVFLHAHKLLQVPLILSSTDFLLCTAHDESVGSREQTCPLSLLQLLLKNTLPEESLLLKESTL